LNNVETRSLGAQNRKQNIKIYKLQKQSASGTVPAPITEQYSHNRKQDLRSALSAE
jgi:hypothetical protein